MWAVGRLQSSLAGADVLENVRRTGASLVGPVIADSSEAFGFEFVAMACPCEIRIAGVPIVDAQRLAELAIGEVRRIETKYSRYRSDSVISQINAAAGKPDAAIGLDSETAQLINFAENLFESSGGLFDCTSGVLRRAWDFKTQTPQLPDQVTLATLLPLVGWQHVAWDGERIALTRQGMELDLGGFGKEYAVDRAAALLEAAGVKHGLVNLGGDVRVLGPRLNGAPWHIGIRDPRAPEHDDDRCFASIAISQGAIATSGDYERFIEVNGQRYCHILNPHTGWPVSHWRSVSVLGPLCVLAGSLATIAMLKADQAVTFLESEGVSYLLSDANGKLTRRTLDAARDPTGSVPKATAGSVHGSAREKKKKR